MYMTDIVVERTDNSEDYKPLLGLTEISVFRIPGSEEGSPFVLTKSHPRRWETTGFIELAAGVEGVDLILKSDDGEDFSFVHLDYNEIRNAEGQVEQGHSKNMEVCDPGVSLTVTWNLAPEMDHTTYTSRGVDLLQLFGRTGNPACLSEAAVVLRRAVESTPKDHDELPGRLSNFGIALQCHFELTGDLEEISEAISVQQAAVKSVPEDHPSRAAMFSNLGNSLMCRFERAGALGDISKAVSAHQASVELTPEGHKALPDRLAGLGSSLVRRFEGAGQLSDIDKGISSLQSAVRLTEVGHPYLPTMLNNLGGSLMRRFERVGNLSDVAEGITVLQKAVNLTPEDHLELPNWLTNLGNLYGARFERTGELSDIAEAIAVQQRAVDITPPGRAGLPTLLNNLGNSFRSRFELTRDLPDIDEAVSVVRRTVELAPKGHAALPDWLDNLGTALTRRFEATSQVSDLTDAVLAQERAVKLAPDGHPILPRWLNNLGTSLIRRFDLTCKLSDIDEGIAVIQRAIHLTPEGHANLPSWLCNLGRALLTRFDQTGSSEDFEKGIAQYEFAATRNFGSPRDRLEAANRWAQILKQYNPRSPHILPALDTALSLLAVIGGMEQTVRGRHAQLRSISGIALEAASTACELERPDKALEWLEQGRCLVWNQLNSLRTPLDGLHTRRPDLAALILDVSKQLESAGASRGHSRIDMSLPEKIELETEAVAQMNLAQQWEELLCQVRAIPGFESFLHPPKFSALFQHLPESGPIIVINVDKQRCDAIALLSGLGEPLHIPLPNFSWQKAKEYHRDLSAQLRSKSLRTEDEGMKDDGKPRERAIGQFRSKRAVGENPVRNVLQGLWVDVVKPILDMLGFSKFDPLSGAKPPRIWWCPTGALSFLPLHAAGVYSWSGSESVLDYAVSSYTPTVSVLTERVRDCRPIDEKLSGLFLTSQPSAPGALPIQETTTEVRSIYGKAVERGIRVLKVEGSELTIDACLNHLEVFSSIHLACHGYQNPEESLESKFRFHNGILDLATIMRKDLKNADLAFLSACQTSTGDEMLSDEAVHLAAGMLAAGYRRVVATMWSIGDRAAQEVANDFYDYLWNHRDGSGSGFDGSLAAYALHHAIKRLREDCGDTDDALLVWAPFVHFGY